MSEVAAQAYLFTGLATYWIAYSVWWYVNTKRFYTQLQLIHRYIFMTLILRSLYCVFSACLYFSGGSGGGAIYWLLVCASTYTLYNTFTFTILLLLSKGYFVTRFVLTRPEITNLAVSMGVIYLAFSAYVIAPDALFSILLVVILFTCLRITVYSRVVIANLKQRLESLTRSGIEPLIRPVQAKLKLMRIFLGVCIFYFVSFMTQIIMTSVFVNNFPTSTNVSWEVSTISFAIEELFELVAISIVCYLFRARSHEQFFTLPDFTGSNEHYDLPSFYNAEVAKASFEVPENDAEKPIVILTPEMQENLHAASLKSILIGVRVQKPRL
mmetsp:Transcript_27537/g.49656  ORF Transcript_27537/g.49656 Transcript_27537/m.49656 type:complete len:326 (+) Transcript_27537:813-1790(+)